MRWRRSAKSVKKFYNVNTLFVKTAITISTEQFEINYNSFPTFSTDLG